MTADQIRAKLKEIAPTVAFQVTYEPDQDYVFYGDPDNDPQNDGMDPVKVTVTAQTVHHGELITGEVQSDGHYAKPGEDPDPDLDGYLPQLLQDAREDLVDQFATDCQASEECSHARRFLEQEMTDRHNARRQEIPENQPE